MKKVILFLSTIFVGLALVTSCTDDSTPEAKPLKLSKEKVSLLMKGTETVKIIDGNGGYKVSSSAEDIATATLKDNVITITGKDVGESKITVTDAEKKTATINVTVTAKDVKVDKTDVTLMVGDKGEVSIQEGSGSYEATADNENVTIKVDGNKITITGAKAGTSKVTVKDTKTKKTTPISVTVTAIPEITLDENLFVVEGKAREVVIQTGTAPYEVKSSSESNLTAVIKEDNKLVLTGVKCNESAYNSTDVKVTITDSKKKSKEITVKVFKKLSLGGRRLEMFKGTTDVTGVVSGNLKAITFDQSGEGEVSAEINDDPYGLKQIQLTGVKAGTCKVVVKDGISDPITLRVTVKEIESVSIWNNSGNIEIETIKVEDEYGAMIIVKGGTGEFDFKANKANKLTFNGYYNDSAGMYYLTLIPNPNDIEGGDVEVTISQKGNPENSDKITVVLPKKNPPIVFSYTKNGETISALDDGTGNDLIKVKVGEIVRINVSGGTATGYNIKGAFGDTTYLDYLGFSGVTGQNLNTDYVDVEMKKVTQGDGATIKIVDSEDKHKYVTFKITTSNNNGGNTGGTTIDPTKYTVVDGVLTAVADEAIVDGRLEIPEGVKEIWKKDGGYDVSILTPSQRGMLIELVIPNGVTKVGEASFMECSNLTSVTIGKDVNFLGYAFASCNAITQVIFKGATPPKLGKYPNSTFSTDIKGNAFLMVPVGAVDAYNKEPWTKWFEGAIMENM